MSWRQDFLSHLDLGKSVAEQDENLNSYYVDTHVYEEVVADRVDIVRGQKGSGKSAILKRLLARGVDGVRIRVAENLSGDLVFRQVFSLAFDQPDKLPSEQILADAWKIYFLSVVVDEIDDCVNQKLPLFRRLWFRWTRVLPLKRQLKSFRILINSRDLQTKLRAAVSRIGVQVTDPSGTSYHPYVDLTAAKKPAETGIPFNAMYGTADAILGDLGVGVWVCLDKLDEAFQNLDDQVERGALRSLLTAYKDVMQYNRFKVKIFIREDIFHKVTYEGFTALTHIRTRTSNPISWDKEKLLHLLVDRIVFPESIRAMLQGIGKSSPTNSAERQDLLRTLLPPKVDLGRESDTFTWVINRVKDGTGVSTPRDVIDLVTYAKRKQLELWSINPPDENGRVVLEPAAFKAALRALSTDKLTSHVFAEYPSLRPVIEKFRHRKAEYDEVSLRSLLGADFERVGELVEIGFFAVKDRERGKTQTWWVPFVYRDGLDITQGRMRANVEDDIETEMIS